ncbi:hypothetical protein PoB_005584300 [Plakobranchus ocellatus]|uniref:Uncharacterized protein n=1 Tax=Plakobranchus ocellatus TaxID=259542 RepID=A0AAV4CEF4_9GAST|nr:hypothetical protein PoB_005584300 [Plakobranchus ocellatus]
MTEMLNCLNSFKGKKRKRPRSKSSTSASSSSSSSSSSDEVGALSSHHKSHSSHRQPTPTQKGKRRIRGVTTTMHCKSRRRFFSSDTTNLEERLLSRHEKAGPSGSTGSIEQKSTKSASDEAHRSLFKAAGEEFEEDNETSGPVSADLSSFINKVFTKKTKVEKLRDKASALKRPENCPHLATPLTNPEIWAVPKSHAKRNDSELTAIQSYVGKSAVAIAQCADALAATHPGETKNLIDALTLLGYAHQCLTLQRKDHQRYALPWDMRGICDPSGETHTSQYLYGDDIRKTIWEA